MNKRILSLAISAGLVFPHLSFTIEQTNHDSVEIPTGMEEQEMQDDSMSQSAPDNIEEASTLLNQSPPSTEIKQDDASLEEQFEKYNTTSTDALEAPRESKNKTWVNIALAVSAFIVATVAILLVAKTDGKNHSQPTN